MAIAIREYMGAGAEGMEVTWNVDSSNSSSPFNMTESTAGIVSDPIAKDAIMVDIEGIHAGPTRNFTWYTEKALQGSVPTWTKPYLRPLIMHHNEKDGKIIGRIRHVAYTEKNTRSNTGALIFTADVPDKEGKEQINDGRLKTVSIGVIVHDCTCSICGHNIAEYGECEDHVRGGMYDGKRCYWMIHSMEAKELSYVIVPSDIYAHNIRVYKPTAAELHMAANYEAKGVLNVAEATKIDPSTGLPVQEGTVIEENGDKGPEAAGTPEPTPAAKPAADTAALEKKIADLEAELKAVKAEKDTLAEDKAKLIEANVNIDKELGDTRVLLDQAQKGLKTAKDQLTVKEAEAIQNLNLRESLEGEIIALKAEQKTSLIENVTSLRKTLGKPELGKEALEKRSEESLRDAVRDLQEELGGAGAGVQITPVTNPGIVESKDDTVKKDHKAGNIDLNEGLENLFHGLMAPRR